MWTTSSPLRQRTKAALLLAFLVFCLTCALKVALYDNDIAAVCCSLRLRSKDVKVDRLPARYSYPVTIVTGYFPFGSRAKHPERDFQGWISNFLAHIERTPLLIFTTAAWAGKMQINRAENPNPGPAIFALYDDVWALPWLQRKVPEKVGNRTTSETSWKRAYEAQHSIDPEKHIHYPELYAAWNSKTWMLKQAVDENPFKSEYFFWVDAGSFRDPHPFRQWPDLDVVGKTLGALPDRLFINLVLGPENFDFQFGESDGLDNRLRRIDFVSGRSFQGTARAVNWWYEEFTRLHDKFYARGDFVGKDQIIMNAAFLLNRNRFAPVQTYPHLPSHCAAGGLEPWTYSQYYFAKPTERGLNCSQLPILYYA